MTDNARSGLGVTLELRAASFRRAGATLLGTLSLHSDARHIGLVGEWDPLFGALTGEVSISSGSARVLGCDLDAAITRGIVGFAACDPPLPASFSVREYLEHAARLSHGSSERAKRDARRTLDEYGLSDLAARKLGQLVAYQRRALGVALAALTAPAVLCLETPLRDLDAASADYVARLCAHAAEGSRLIISAALPSTPSAERALVDACEQVFLLQRDVLVAQGSPESVFAPGARYLVTLVGSKASEFVTALSQAECRLTEQPTPTALSGLLAPGSRVARYLVELPEGGKPELVLDAALVAGVTVLEFEPLFGR